MNFIRFSEFTVLYILKIKSKCALFQNLQESTGLGLKKLVTLLLFWDYVIYNMTDFTQSEQKFS